MPDPSLTSLAAITARALDDRGADIPDAIRGLFQSRYHSRHAKDTSVRNPYDMRDDGNVPYAGVIAPDNPTSGAYGGASLAWFPCAGGTLMTLVVGTKGLVPDEGLLTRHGHRRRVTALRQYLAKQGIVAWSKADPAAINVDMPETARRLFPDAAHVFRKYGQVIYSAAWIPKGNESIAYVVVHAYLDLYARERSWNIKREAQDEYEGLLDALHSHLFAQVTPEQVDALLRQRRFVVLQGPPGTGKTRMAELVRSNFFGGRGRTVQFHPVVTYEDFVVGLSPDPTSEGLRFKPKAGWLLDAAREAKGQDYLLVIDEINRGDLGKVLGEAIYLFEPGEVGGSTAREVHLTHALTSESGDATRTFRLPPNLYVLGTMNTADRSIAGLDLAVRRRFAFVTLMPDPSVPILDMARDAFQRLTDVFVEHASDDMLHLLPGHSYFLAKDEAELKNRFRYDLLPLLDEYLRQGLMGTATSDLYAVRDHIYDVVFA
jgi:5-methylcytosine-specific restriction protein B